VTPFGTWVTPQRIRRPRVLGHSGSTDCRFGRRSGKP
jgi:hypothetical protein